MSDIDRAACGVRRAALSHSLLTSGASSLTLFEEAWMQLACRAPETATPHAARRTPHASEASNEAENHHA